MEDLIGQGRTADVFRYGESKVIKVFHDEFDWLAYEEYVKVKIIDNVGVPAPKVYGFADADGNKGIVYEYVQGISMFNLMQRYPLKVARYAKRLADLHATIHKKTLCSLPNIKESLLEAIQTVQSITQVEKDAIISYMDTLPDGYSLCHYDFHPDNVLLQNGDAKVIDWMTAGAGDPCVDVCRTSVILNSNTLPPNVSAMKEILTNTFRKIFYRSYIHQYLKVTGTTQQNVNKWLLPVAAARLAEGIESEIPYLNGIIAKKMSEYGLC